MLGVVLCGGQSTRMGSDKGLLTSNQYTWAQEAAAKLTALSMPVLVSVNSRQLESYATLFESSFLIPDDTTLRLGGPLSGILSVHRKFPKEDLMVLACDMLLMESFILRELYDARQEHPGFEAYIFTNGGNIEPLAGIYTAGALGNILKKYALGEMTKFSMKYVIEHLRAYTRELPASYLKYFQNFNDPL